MKFVLRSILNSALSLSFSMGTFDRANHRLAIVRLGFIASLINPRADPRTIDRNEDQCRTTSAAERSS